MLKVLCFGNPHFEKDKLALEVGRKLKKQKIPGIGFVECGMDDGMLDESRGENFVVLDVVKGIDAVRFIEQSELKTAKTITAHDIDTAFYLRLLEKEGKKIRIIGIPEGMRMENAARDVEALLKPLVKKS